jgi:hypothetical protein
VPAAAVIPALIAYIKVVAVKKLVVGSRGRAGCRPMVGRFSRLFLSGDRVSLTRGVGTQIVYFEKIRVFKAGFRLNTLAWNNGIGLRFYFVGF